MPSTPPSPQPTLTVTSLSKTYGQRKAVRNISFSVYPGEIFALIGPNGAGKSTTLRMVATILTPSAGTITINGADTAHDPEAVRRSLSYLPEEAGAYRTLSGRAYLQFMAALYSPDLTHQRDYLQRGTAIASLGQQLNDKIGTYSKGMTRKLLLARAIMAEPALAILDEPTSGLDVVNAFAIRETIKALARENQIAVLLSSHNMLEVEHLSDRVAIINQGQILASDTPAKLKAAHHADNLEEVFVRVTKQR